MMNNIFEVIDKTGRNICLTSERWSHITDTISLHPYMTNYLEEIKAALVRPSKIIIHSLDDKKADYCLHLKEKKVYLLVGVKYLNGGGGLLQQLSLRES